MGRLVRDDRTATVTQITIVTTKVQNTISEHNTSNPEADGLQQQKTTPGALLSAKNRKRRLQFTQAQNWTIEDWKTLSGLMSLDFCCDIQMIGSEFGIKNMKTWIHPALSQRFRWWWCNVGDIFLACFGPLSTN